MKQIFYNKYNYINKIANLSFFILIFLFTYNVVILISPFEQVMTYDKAGQFFIEKTSSDLNFKDCAHISSCEKISMPKDIWPASSANVNVYVYKDNFAIKICASLLLSLLLFFCIARGFFIDFKVKEKLKAINIRSLLLYSSFFVLASAIVSGADAKGLGRAMYYMTEGIDPYFYQVNAFKISGFSYPSFPHSPYLAALIQVPFSIIHFSGLFGGDVIISIIGSLAYILSCLTLKDLLKVDNKVFLLSMFNPLMFYAVVVFVKVDIITVYFFLLALSLLRRERYIPGYVLLASSALMKPYYMILYPAFFLFVVMEALRKESLKERILQIGGFILISVLFFLSYKFLFLSETSSYKLLISTSAQIGRIWAILWPIAPDVFLYSIFFLLPLVFSLFTLRAQVSDYKHNVMQMFLLIGACTQAYQFSIMHTPGFYAYLLPAVFVLNATMFKNDLQKAVFFAVSATGAISWDAHPGDLLHELTFSFMPNPLSFFVTLESSFSILFVIICGMCFMQLNKSNP